MKRVCACSLLVVVLMLSKCFGGTGGIPAFSLFNPQVETQRIAEFWSYVAFDFNDVPVVVRSLQSDIRNYLEERIENARRILDPNEDEEEVILVLACAKEHTMLNHFKIRDCVGNDLNTYAIARMLYYFPFMVVQNVLRKLRDHDFYGKRLERTLPEQRELFRLILEESRRFAGVLLVSALQE